MRFFQHSSENVEHNTRFVCNRKISYFRLDREVSLWKPSYTRITHRTTKL